MLLKVKLWLYIWATKNMYGYTKVSTKLLFAQAWHETGNFKSKVYKENNNLFGMREPSVRKTFATGTSHAHATFKNHLDSVRDYFERQKYFKIDNSNDSQYILDTVDSNYAEDPNYASKWQNIASTIKMPVNNYFLIIGLFFFGFIAYKIYKKSK